MSHRTHSSLRVDTIPADLADADGVTNLIAELDKRASPRHLINNAGSATWARLKTSDLSKIESMLAVNIAALRASPAGRCPAWLARRAAGFGNVGSTAAFIPLPTSAVYAAPRPTSTSSPRRSASRCTAPASACSRFARARSKPNSAGSPRVKTAGEIRAALLSLREKTEVVRETADRARPRPGPAHPGLMAASRCCWRKHARWILRLVFT